MEQDRQGLGDAASVDNSVMDESIGCSLRSGRRMTRGALHLDRSRSSSQVRGEVREPIVKSIDMPNQAGLSAQHLDGVMQRIQGFIGQMSQSFEKSLTEVSQGIITQVPSKLEARNSMEGSGGQSQFLSNSQSSVRSGEPPRYRHSADDCEPDRRALHHRQTPTGGRHETGPWDSERESNPRRFSAGRVSLSLPKFNGRGDFTSFEAQFKLMARQSHWDYGTSGEMLGCALEGPAQRYYARLPEPQRYDYDWLMPTLWKRYGHTYTDMSKEKLLDRVREPGERIEDLADDIWRMVAEAYPTVEEEFKEMLALDAMKRGVDKELRLRFVDKSVTTLRQAVDETNTYESVMRPNIGSGRNGNKKTVRAISTTSDDWSVAATGATRPNNPGLAKVEKDVSELKGRVASLETKAEKASQDSEEIKGKLETILTKIQGPRELGNSWQPRGYQANRYQGEDPRDNGNRNQSYQNRNVPTIEIRQGKIDTTQNVERLICVQ